MEIIQGNLIAQNNRFALVVSRFNEIVSQKLVDGAIDFLLRHNVKEEDIERLSNLLEDKSLYYLYETTEGYFFPYYPITFYDFYISNDNNVIQRLEVVENGRIFCNDSDYYSFDRAEIFKVIDDFYNSLNYK